MPCTAFARSLRRFRRTFPLLGVATLLFTPGLISAQSARLSQPAARIRAEINGSERSVLPGSLSPSVRNATDTGALDGGTRLNGITLSFAPSPAQQSELDSLIAAQGDPASALYHQWLTPEQFGARFGMADADLAKVQGWLASQGFSIDSVARSRNRITFSGAAAQAATAFGAPLHTYREGTESHFAPSAELSLPSAFAATVADIGNLSTFRPRPHLRKVTPDALSTRFTSSQSGSHTLTPADIATIYDITPAYNAGYNGTGQTIAVVGQSSILTTDIAHFQSAAGLPVKAPTLVLVPNSGVPTVYTDDEAESDLDVEYSGGIATGATIDFVYAGNNANYDVFDALSYAITERIAPVISVSYGVCENALSSSTYATRNAVLAQGAVQGQTIIVAAGDSGSTDCSGVTSLSTTLQQGLAVDFPASSQYVTGMGGTEFSAATTATTNTTYWKNASGSDVVSSALSYIPEGVWNDDTVSSGTLTLSSTGGGTSILTARPTWQAGVPGIPTGSFRLVPDVSLDSALANAPYLYCSSDDSTNISGSCSNGFRDINNANLTAAGGTSFAAPIFAGMIAVLNGSLNSTGLGLLNPTLYSLASNNTTYASAFHDITSGTNACTAGVSGCSAAAAASYAATTGYDEATGLGSVDFYKLLTAWPGRVTPAPAGSTVTLSAATLTPAASASDTITIQVASTNTSLTGSPTGTVSLLVDGVSAGSALALSGGAVTYSFSSAAPGTHTIAASYSGDAVFGASTSTLVLTVGTPPSTAAFAVAVPMITLTAGSSGTATTSVTPSNGYTGTVTWTLKTNAANFCYSIANLAISGTAATSTTLTVYTSSASCSSATIKRLPVSGPTAKVHDPFGPSPRHLPAGGTGLALASLVGCGLLARRSRRLRPLLALLVLVGAGFGLSGCGGSSSATTATAFTAAGSYTVTLTGTDTVNAALNSSTVFTVKVN